jgi:hypothetical protein
MAPMTIDHVMKRRLREAAKKDSDSTAAIEHLIYEAKTAGASYREVTEETGRSRGDIGRIVERIRAKLESEG